MERRLLLVFALTFLVIIVCQPLLKKYLPQPATPPAQTQNQTQTQPVTAASQTAGSAQPSSPAAIAAGVKQASSESEKVIENDLYRIVFTNHGGRVKSWVLKKYFDDGGQPLDLVNPVAAEKYGYPLSLWTYDEGQRNKINSALYVVSQVDQAGEDGKPVRTLTFEFADQDVSVKKSFRFGESYVVDIETSVLSRGNLISSLPMWPAGFGDETTSASYAASRIEYHNEESTERSYLVFPSLTGRLAIKAVSSGNTMPGPFNWAGVVDQYFAAVFIPQNPHTTTTVVLRNSIDIPKDPKKPQDTQKVEVLGAAVGNLNGPSVERLFVGPKSLKVVEEVPVSGMSDHGDLRDLVNFGFFGPIARPLFLWLRWTHEHIVSQLGLGDCPADLDHQPGIAAAADFQHEIRAEDAEDPAQDECHQGQIQEIWNAGPAPPGDERRNRVVDEAGRRQPSRRLSAHAYPDAVPVRLLQHAQCRARPSARALAVDWGPFVGRPPLHSSHPLSFSAW